MIGEATYGQVALFFSLIGMLNAALLWPLSLGLFLTGVETLHWDRLPWPALLSASCLSLGKYLTQSIITQPQFHVYFLSIQRKLGQP